MYDAFLEAGADVNVPDRYGNTVMLTAAWGGHDKCVALSLKKGALINYKTVGMNPAYLITCMAKFKPVTCMLLFAAGEMLNENFQDKMAFFFRFNEIGIQLKHLCREAIRKHLIKLEPNVHLFDRIPRLGLPTVLAEYLLYGVSLENWETLTTLLVNDSPLEPLASVQIEL